MPRLNRTGWLGLIVVALALANTGCLPVVVGGLVAAGGAAGYAYYAGEYKREFEAGAAEVRLAARAALSDQSMVVLEEHSDPAGGWVVSRTPTGNRVSITFNDFPDPQAPTGFVTRVGVRVSAFGDSDYSRQLLDNMGTRLGLAASPMSPPPGTPTPTTPAIPTNRLVPRPGESAPPPLADSSPSAPRSSDSPTWQAPKK